MSGTLSSRFQPRFGYGPGLRVGQYPGSGPSLLPSVAPPPVAQPGGLPAAAGSVAQPAPAAPETPISAGSVPQSDSGSGWDQQSNSTQDLGPNPGQMGSLTDLSYGQIGSVLGGIAGMATGVPGLGTVAGAFGGLLDAQSLNGTLQSMGLAPNISELAAMANAASPFGMAGMSADQQFGNIAGKAHDLDAVESFFGFSTLNEIEAQQAAEAAAAAAAAAEQQAMEQGMPSPGFGGTYGYGTDPANGIGSGDFGAASAAGRGESVGPPGPDAAYGGSESGGTGGTGGGVGGADASDSPGGDGDGWQAGGYTGAGQDGAVQPAQPAGRVHEGEVVIPAHMVQHYGLPLLMGLVDGSVPRSKLAALAGLD